MESSQEKPDPERTMAQAQAASSNSSAPPTATHKMDLAAFDGSFAPLVRPQAVRLTPWYRRRDYFVGQWFEPALWRSAVVECIATCCQVFLASQIAATISTYGTPQVGAYIGISNLVLLATFIYAVAPASGGHMNPLITFAAMLTGLCSVPRGILYIVGQTAGGALAGGILLGIWGKERAIAVRGGGCWYDPSQANPGQIYLNETFASFVLLFLAFGVGLDPRQAALFGPRMGPALVGASLGLVTFSTSGIIPGYAGAQMNPAKCFGNGIARLDLSYQWIYWFGPAVAGIMMGVLYNLIPPHHAELAKRKSREMAETSIVGA
ncbi:aquaporin-like protein [Trichoderma austrokoningii]